MSRLFIILLVVLVVASGCYDSHDDGLPVDNVVHTNCDIALLRNICRNECYTITEDIVCTGRVVSSDREGNFYRSLVIADNSGAVEIKLGIYNTASQYPVGLKISLILKGMAAMVEDGVVKVGLPPQSFDREPRELEAQEVIDNHVIRSNSVEKIDPLIYKITSLNTSLCGRLVKLCNLHHAPLANRVEEEYYRFVDREGNAIFVNIGKDADFYNLEMPTSELSVQGILYYSTVGMNVGKQFIIKPCSKDDLSVALDAN